MKRKKPSPHKTGLVFVKGEVREKDKGAFVTIKCEFENGLVNRIGATLMERLAESDGTEEFKSLKKELDFNRN